MTAFRDKLLNLVEGFYQKKISAPVFSSAFINLYKKDEEHIEEPYGRFFDAVFVACDTYCEDENLRDEEDFDDNQFALRIAELHKGMKTV